MAQGNTTAVGPQQAKIEISRDLSTLEFSGPTATVVPEDIYYQQESATTWTPQGGASWIIIPPAKGMLLHDKPLIEWRMIIQNYYAEEYTNYIQQIQDNCVFRVAPRQCNPISNSMMTFAVVINGQVLDYEPVKYAHIMDRVHSTNEESSIVFSKSGGELDSGIGLRFVLPVDMGANNLNYMTRYKTTIDTAVLPSGTRDATQVATVDGVIEMISGANIQTDGPFANLDIGNSLYVNHGLAARKRRFDLYRQNFGNTGVKFPNIGSSNGGLNTVLFTQGQGLPNLAEGTILDKAFFKKSFWEVPPCAPFSQYQSRDRQETIPHIEQMSLQARFRPDKFTQLILQCACVYRGTSGEGVNNIVGSFMPGGGVGLHAYHQFQSHGKYTVAANFNWITNLNDLNIQMVEAPVFHMKWLQPPSRMQIKPVARIPITRYVNFETPQDLTISQAMQNQVLAVSPGGAGNPLEILPSAGGLDEFMQGGIGNKFVFRNTNIRLESMPDRFYICVQRNQTEKQLWHPTEHNLAITNIKINADGKSGRFQQATAYELWTISMKYYAQPVPFEFWFWSSCICVFTAADLGVHVGPGWNRPISLHLEVETYYNKNLALSSNFCIQNQIGRACLTDNTGAGGPFYTDKYPCIDSQWPAIGNFTPFNVPGGDQKANYVLQVTCEYSRYVLTLGEDGRSDLRMITA